MVLPKNHKNDLTDLSAQLDQNRILNLKLTEANQELSRKVEMLEDSSLYLNSVLCHMSQGALCIDALGNIAGCNVSAGSLLEIDSQKVLTYPYFDHFSDNFFGFSLKYALIHQQVNPKTFVIIKTPSGIKRELEIDTTIIAGPNTNFKGIIILMRDITDSHQLRELANRRNHMQILGEMSAMVAHEIRNPLGSIKGFASLLALDLEDEPVQHRMAMDIIKGADNLNLLVTNILNYARPLQPNFISVDLLALTEDLCHQIEADQSLDTRIQIECHSSTPSLMVPVDVSLLKSALLNLLRNAIQAMPSGGKISIGIDHEGSHAVLKVADTGEGIPEENMKKLFMPFFTTKKRGNGFGLTEVQRVIQAHGGSVEVQSVLGEGTTFIVKLPLTAYGAMN